MRYWRSRPPFEGAVGSVAARTIRSPGQFSPLLRKGQKVGAADLGRLLGLGVDELDLLTLDDGDLDEDQAGLRLARAIAGTNIGWSRPHQSQVRLSSLVKGLLTVDQIQVDRINALAGVSVFTLFDGQAVLSGQEVAGTKVTALAIEEAVVEQVERLCQTAKPIGVEAFRRLRAAVLIDGYIKPATRRLFESAVQRKLGWYGAEHLGTWQVDATESGTLAAYRRAQAESLDLLIFAGANSLNPLDPAFSQLEPVGAQIVHFGVPAHPGSMCWIARLGSIQILGVASCAGFGRDTAMDLLLPLVFSGRTLTAADVKRLGYGGLIEQGAGRTFPAYDR